MHKVFSGLMIGLITSTFAITSMAASTQDQDRKAPPEGMMQGCKAPLEGCNPLPKK